MSRVDPVATRRLRDAARRLRAGERARRERHPEVARSHLRAAVRGSVAATYMIVDPRAQRPFPTPPARIRVPAFVPTGMVFRWKRAVRMYERETLPLSWLSLDAQRTCSTAVTVLERTARLLDAVARSREPLGAAALARELRVPRRDADRVLRSYVAAKRITRAKGRYLPAIAGGGGRPHAGTRGPARSETARRARTENVR